MKRTPPSVGTWRPVWSAGLTALILLICIAAQGAEPPDLAPNQLSPEERRAGWKLLFDGRTTCGWRGFHQETFPEKGWRIEDGCLKKSGEVRGGNIVTVEQFDDFELRWDWRIAPMGNNGVKYFVTEIRGRAAGHEYQLLDDRRARKPESSAGAFYDVLPPATTKRLHKPGQWNHSRIVVRDTRVEHWLNGQKILEYTLGSEELRAAIARSKFKNAPGFGKKIRGHIMLTDHKDECWFRNIKIRILPAAPDEAGR